MPAHNIRAVLFDLDGTLIDHFATLHACFSHAITSLGLPAPSAETVRRSVGGSMEITMHKLIPAEHVSAAAAIWREHFSRIYLDDVSLMPGAAELAGALAARGLRLGVFTNKIGETSRRLCEHLGISRHFRLVLGANDSPWRKPQPEFTALALRELGSSAAETALVGDSPYDIQAAHAGGLPAWCVTTGTHTHEELAAAGADAIFPDLPTLGRSVFALA